jgi:hemoglobin-like flavoprotein
MIDINEVFNDSFERITPVLNDFVDGFYSSFLEQSESIKTLFDQIDMNQQKNMLKESFLYLINFAATKKADSYLCEIAQSHQQKLLISGNMYDIWLESLVQTLKSFDKKFTPSVELAWRVSMAPGIEFMKSYPDHSS